MLAGLPHSVLPATGANLECPECVTAFPRTAAGLHELIECMCLHHREVLRNAGIHPVHDVHTQAARERTYRVAEVVGARSLLHQARIRAALERLHDPTPEHISLPSTSTSRVSIFPDEDIGAQAMVTDAPAPSTAPAAATAMELDDNKDRSSSSNEGDDKSASSAPVPSAAANQSQDHDEDGVSSNDSDGSDISESLPAADEINNAQEEDDASSSSSSAENAAEKTSAAVQSPHTPTIHNSTSSVSHAPSQTTSTDNALHTQPHSGPVGAVADNTITGDLAHVKWIAFMNVLPSVATPSSSSSSSPSSSSSSPSSSASPADSGALPSTSFAPASASLPAPTEPSSEKNTWNCTNIYNFKI